MDDNSVTITIDNDGFTEIVFASKLDLERCQYFRDRILQLEKHPEEETLYIEDVDPDAFHNFLKCLKKNLVKSTKFDALIPLATLAERFGAEELGNLCVKELTKNLSENNIWQTYNEYLNSKYITLACEEVLMSNTEEFLNSPKFLDIDPETLSHFLSLKKLDMVDKSLLVYCCDKYTWKNTSKDSLPLKEQRKLTGVKLDALIPLTASAERFDAELLGRFCIDELKKNLSIHNIWEIYNEHLESRYITIACLEVLNTNTEEFLKSPRFLDIDLETLCDFLSFMKTGLANEAVLVDYCDKYASTKKHGDSVCLKEQRKQVKGTKLEALSALAASAERFGREELRMFCVDELKNNLSVHNIWQIYNEHLESEYVTLACEEVLMRNTEKFLVAPEFLDINLETLSHFLSHTKMDMVNKAVLIDYCDRYASTKKRGDSLCMEEKRKLVHSTELEVLLALAASAERVGTKELGKLCVDEIKKFLSVQNIWQIYKKNLESKYVALACEEVVMQYTKEFLSSPQLSAINPETVFHFLSLTKMDIANEAVPLDCCNNYAWKKEHWHSLCLEEQRELVHSSRLEVLIALATSAEQFGAEKLGKFCVDKLKNLLSVQNVWQIYNEHLKSKYVALACEEVFKRNTEEFLKSPHFFYIDPETLFHFLSLTRMDIANEDVLVDYCNSYAWWNRDWNSLLPNEKRKLVKITKFEALSALAASVERVGANELRKLCIDELKFNLSVHNIWQIYNKNLESEGVTLACEEMLMRNTEEFLKSPHFLEIDPETLSHFLSLKMLDIASEAVLIDYCDKYASTKKHGDSLFMFREYAIPYLRLLTLTEDEMNGPIKKYLEDFKWSSCLQEIKLGTSREPINSFAGEGLHMQARFCKVRIERTLDSEASCTLTIVPDELVANLKDTLLNDSISVPKTAKHNFALLFKPNRDILIKEFEFFLPLSIQRNSKNWCMEQMEHDFQTFSSSFHARIVVESTAKTCCTSFDLSKNMQDGLVTLRPSVDVKVDRFTDVRIEVIICGNSYLPDLGAIVDDCVEHKRKYVERNKVFVNCTSGKLQFQHYELDEESTVLREEKNTIFKSVLFDSITY